MQLFQLHNGDEFAVKGEVETFKLLPSDDQVFLGTGFLRVQNVLTGVVTSLDGNVQVELMNVA